MMPRPMDGGGAAALQYESKATRAETTGQLFRALVLLAVPVWFEQLLHTFVGVTDTYIANHVVPLSAGMTAQQVAAAQQENVYAGAAVNTAAYLLWFVGLVAGAIGIGSTALIARATGARHQRLANSICGQSIALAGTLGVVSAILVYLFAGAIADTTGLQGRAHDLALSYIQRLSFAMPFMIILFVANACLRGAGDTITPAIAMITVDATNILLCLTLTRGWFGLPTMGFNGIATGTMLAYSIGGCLQLGVLLVGRGGIQLFPHRLRPHWRNMGRLLRIGLPSGFEGALQWGVNYALVRVINQMDPSQISGAAHGVAVRIEAFSYLTGFAMATTAATMVGQSLGMRDPRRAAKSAYLAYAVGGTAMALYGIVFVLFSKPIAGLMSNDPGVVELTARCLFIAGFIQAGFAAAMVFSGSLRGAGDTLSVMIINLSSLILVRFCGVLILVRWFSVDLPTIWILLSCELTLRGALMFGWFLRGGWKRVSV